MRKLVLCCFLVLLLGCQKEGPLVEATAVSPTTTNAAPALATPLPAPAIAEETVENTAVPPTVTAAPTDSNGINSVIEKVSSLEATIARQVMLVYDTEGGLWERSAIVENTNVRVLPEQTVDGRVIPLDEPIPYQTPHQSLINILREIENGGLHEHTVAAWEENGRYHLQIDTLYDSPLPAENNSTGQSLNGGKMHLVFNTETGELLQQQNWIVSGTGEETLQGDANWSETAVVSDLPPLAAQTLSDAHDLLNQAP